MKTIAFLLLFMWFGNSVAISPVTTNTYGPIKNGEKLWNIATQIRPDSSITRYQAMLALLKVNPHAFEISCNLNTLKIGQTLHIPSLADMQALTPKQAVNEFYRQNQEWKTYRQKQQPIVCPSSVKLSPPPQVESPIYPPEKAVITQTTTDATMTVPPPSSFMSTTKTTSPTSTIGNEMPNSSSESVKPLPLIPSATPPPSTMLLNWNDLLSSWFSTHSMLSIMIIGTLMVIVLFLLAFLLGWRLQKYTAHKSVTQKHDLSAAVVMETPLPVVDTQNIKGYPNEINSNHKVTSSTSENTSFTSKESMMLTTTETPSVNKNSPSDDMKEKLDYVRAHLVEDETQIVPKMLRDVIQKGTAEQQTEAKQLYEIHKKMNYLKQNAENKPEVALQQTIASNSPSWQSKEQMNNPQQYLPTDRKHLFELVDKIFELLDSELGAQGKLIDAYLNRPQQEFFTAKDYEVVEKPEKVVVNDSRDDPLRSPRYEPTPPRHL